MKKILFAIATIVMAFSCTMVNEVNDVNVGKNVIKATSGEETRTAIKDNGDNTYSHVWEKGDAFVLYDVITPLKYEIVGEGGDTKADFAGEALSGETALYPVFYPYADNIDIYYADGINFFEYTFPSEVNKAVGNYAQNVMIGLSDGKNVQMMNCASYVKFAYSTNLVSYVDSIKIEALGGEPLSGKFRFGIDGATSSVISVPDEKLTAENAKVLVKFDGSEALTANARTFYVALPPVELSNGLQFTLYGEFNGEQELVFTSSTAQLERNTVLDFDEIQNYYALDVAEVTIGSEDPVIYENVNKAFESALGATEPVVIKMLNPGMFTAQVVYTTEDVTVDLNGKTLTSAGTKRVNLEGEDAVLNIIDSSEGNGTWTQSNSGSYTVYTNAGTINMNGGNISMVDGATTACVYATGEKAVFNMNGGKVLAKVTALNAATINMTGGEVYVEGTEHAFNLTGSPCNVEFNMTGGKIYSESGDAVHGCYTNVKINITGGEISSLHGRGIITYGNTLIENCIITAVDSAALRTAYAPEITIRNSSLSSAADTTGGLQGATIYLRSSSGSGIKCTIENSDIINTNSNGNGRSIYTHGTSSSCPCNLTIKSGNVSASNIALYVYARSVVTVEDGTIVTTGDCRAAHVGSSTGNLVINGGWFNNANSTKTTIGRYNTSTKVTIYGGYFTGGLPSGTVAEGYTFYSYEGEKNPPYTGVVKKSN